LRGPPCWRTGRARYTRRATTEDRSVPIRRRSRRTGIWDGDEADEWIANADRYDATDR